MEISFYITANELKETYEEIKKPGTIVDFFSPTYEYVLKDDIFQFKKSVELFSRLRTSGVTGISLNPSRYYSLLMILRDNELSQSKEDSELIDLALLFSCLLSPSSIKEVIASIKKGNFFHILAAIHYLNALKTDYFWQRREKLNEVIKEIYGYEFFIDMNDEKTARHTITEVCVLFSAYFSDKIYKIMEIFRDSKPILNHVFGLCGKQTLDQSDIGFSSFNSLYISAKENYVFKNEINYSVYLCSIISENSKKLNMWPSHMKVEPNENVTSETVYFRKDHTKLYLILEIYYSQIEGHKPKNTRDLVNSFISKGLIYAIAVFQSKDSLIWIDNLDPRGSNFSSANKKKLQFFDPNYKEYISKDVFNFDVNILNEWLKRVDFDLTIKAVKQADLKKTDNSNFNTFILIEKEFVGVLSKNKEFFFYPKDSNMGKVVQVSAESFKNLNNYENSDISKIDIMTIMWIAIVLDQLQNPNNYQNPENSKIKLKVTTLYNLMGILDIDEFFLYSEEFIGKFLAPKK